MGLGISFLINIVQQFSWFLEIIKMIIGIIAIILSIMSFQDFIAMKKGKYSEVELKGHLYYIQIFCSVCNLQYIHYLMNQLQYQLA